MHEFFILANQTIEIVYMQNETFSVPSNFSYHCNHEQTLNATTDPKDEKFIVLSKVQLEAFKVDNTKKFSLAKDCDSNVKPDIIPIAVGLSLIALIVIVLIAFIVGRRRSQARGYLNIM
jgi:lysosomal-associated membrane protein 1/2